MINGIQAYQNYEIFFRSFNSLKTHDAAGQKIHQTMSGIFAARNIQLSQSLVEKEISSFMDGFKSATESIKSVVDSINDSTSKTFTSFAEITPLEPTKSSFSIEVKQLAQAQVVTSNAYEASGKDLLNENTTSFTIKTNDNNYTIDIDTSNLQDNRDYLNELSTRINEETPLTSQVIENEDGVSIEISSPETGEENRFEITSPTSPITYTYTSQARDLIAQVDDLNYRSSSNTVIAEQFIIDFSEVTERVDVEVERPEETLAFQREGAVASLNNLAEFLSGQERSNARDDALNRIETIQKDFDQITDDMRFEQSLNSNIDETSTVFNQFIEELESTVQELEELPLSRFFLQQEQYLQVQQGPSDFYQSLFSGNSIDLTI